MRGRKGYMLQDAHQNNGALWRNFQADVRYRMEHQNDPPEPPPPPPKHKSLRGPKVVKPTPPPEPEPTDWTGKVALALYQHMKKSQQRVTDIFKRFDTDSSQALDASEFHFALIELGIPTKLKIPEDEWGNTLQNVFDAMDDDGARHNHAPMPPWDAVARVPCKSAWAYGSLTVPCRVPALALALALTGNGVLSFKEINHYLRAGRYEVVLDDKLKTGAVAVQAPKAEQTHRLRRKEEWIALDRFKALDADFSGDASIREVHAFFISEGYDRGFVDSLMAMLDVNNDGQLSAEEWRQGVTDLQGSSLLMSMTDPIYPPTGENFKDLGTPTEVVPPAGYLKAHAKGTLHVPPQFQQGKLERGCVIPEAENRGTRLCQLRTVCDHISRRCVREKWVDCDSEPLEPKTATMYDTVAYVVKPATRKSKNSLVEAISRGPQPPKWFCSHWWGMPVLELLTCLEQQARDRMQDLNSATYWISSFAYTLWSVTDHVPDDPMRSAVYRAMSKCTGTVAVLDASGTFFGRVWCVFEVGRSLELIQERDEAKSGAFQFDMYTSCAHRVPGELIEQRDAEDNGTDFYNFVVGPIAPERRGQKGVLAVTEARTAVGVTEGECESDKAPGAKQLRESFFPSQLYAPALAVKLQAATASVDSDRNYVLNTIQGGKRGAELMERAAYSHPKYQAMNAAIRGYIARSSLVRAVIELGRGDETMFEALLEGLQGSTVTRVDFCFGQAMHEGVEVPARVFERLIEVLPDTVEHVVMELPKNVTKLPDNKLKIYPKLHTLEIVNSPGLEALPADVTECFSLCTLELTGCSALKEVPKRLFDLKHLTSLNLTGCASVRTLTARGVSKSALEALILRDCTQLAELPDQLGANLVNLHTLILRGCPNLVAVPYWVPDMEKRGAAVQRPEHLG